jgi:hypothetical protein
MLNREVFQFRLTSLNIKKYIVASTFHASFLELHSTTQTLTTRTHTHLYEYTYANPTLMSTSEGLSTGRSGDSRSHQWRLVVYGNVAYHLTHNTGKSWKIQEKVRAPGFEPWWVASHWTVLQLDYKPNRTFHASSPTPACCRRGGRRWREAALGLRFGGSGFGGWGIFHGNRT